MRFALTLVCGLAAMTVPSVASDDYLDDRSDAVSLVQSLYNAINRKEYARAWSYFSTPPAASLDEYAAGYSDTESVVLRTGRASEEGAAGSLFYQLPVAIEARGSGGASRVFAGCYELRMANPAVATDEFTPLLIERGRFSVASEPLDEAVPAFCGDGPALPPADLVKDRAVALYEKALGETCLLTKELPAEELEPESHELSFRYFYETESEPEHRARLFRFLCNRGAYNESHAYIYSNEYNELRVLSFATPELDIRYRDDDTDGPVDAIYVIGFRSAGELVNSEYDPAGKTINSWSKWRGLGDASSVGTWLFRGGEFSLVRFDVDASYDGEVNPQTVVDYATGP